MKKRGVFFKLIAFMFTAVIMMFAIAKTLINCGFIKTKSAKPITEVEESENDG